MAAPARIASITAYRKIRPFDELHHEQRTRGKITRVERRAGQPPAAGEVAGDEDNSLPCGGEQVKNKPRHATASVGNLPMLRCAARVGVPVSGVVVCAEPLLAAPVS
jgi:hypothetical protein